MLKKGAVAGRTAARVFVKALDVVLCGSVKGFRLPLRRGALACDVLDIFKHLLRGQALRRQPVG